MTILLTTIAIAPLIVGIYAYVLYPAILAILAGRPRAPRRENAAVDWPSVTIAVPVYNAAGTIRVTLEALLELDYPRDKLQIMVVSDGSVDGTDDIVRDFTHRGIELLQIPIRKGKTAAENAVVAVASSEIVVNVDATICVPRQSLKPLIRAFDDATVGVASGRDCSTGRVDETVGGESGYVGYEMWVRDLETRSGSIVGASGCFYAFRRSIRSSPLPPDLSWDFASPLVARVHGLRSVSVSSAVCLVPRTRDLRIELRRKVRTMARGIRTLFYHKTLMNPMRYGLFAFMLVSHKLCRWLPFLIAPISISALGALSITQEWARLVMGLVLIGVGLGTLGMRTRVLASARLVSIAGFGVASFTAGFLAWVDVFRSVQMATWDPTPRTEVSG
jgi:cellulose synthase/poly-beta-1,6-N-acetylglucosamine synthase-like glycosyltransferase